MKTLASNVREILIGMEIGTGLGVISCCVCVYVWKFNFGVHCTAYEASLLRLIETMTNGSEISINGTGTTVTYKPGFIIGGLGLEHSCDVSRSIGYYLEAVVALSPFAKKPTKIVLHGVTNDDKATSVSSRCHPVRILGPYFTHTHTHSRMSMSLRSTSFAQ